MRLVSPESMTREEEEEIRHVFGLPDPINIEVDAGFNDS